MKDLLGAILISFLFCLNINAQKEKAHLNSWYAERKDEGKIASESYSWLDKGKLYYFLSNDNDILSIDLKVEDPVVQNRILNEGLTVWIDMDNKLSRKLGIRFPLGSQNSGGHNRSKISIPETNPDGSHVSLISMANTIELTGFTGENAMQFPSDNADTFRAYVKYDNENTLHYKLIIPVLKLPLRNTKDRAGAMPFNIGIEYGALTETNGSRGQFINTAPAKPSGPSGLFWIKNVKLATDK